MNRSNLVGAFLCVVAFLTVFALSDGAGHFLNVVGLLIVISGTCGASLLSYPFDDLTAAWRVALRSYSVRAPTAHQVIDTLLQLAVKSRKEGILALRDDEKKIEVSYLKDALGMMVDGFDRHELRAMLESETRFFQRRRERHERVFRHMARLAPAFGVTGSVVGLIGMVSGIGDTTVILKAIPLALTSTLYGIVLCNFLLIPIAESIHFKTRRELMMQQLVLEGVMAIVDEDDPLKLERRLISFLTPGQRAGKQMTFKQIRRRYHTMRPGREPA